MLMGHFRGTLSPRSYSGASHNAFLVFNECESKYVQLNFLPPFPSCGIRRILVPGKINHQTGDASIARDVTRPHLTFSWGVQFGHWEARLFFTSDTLQTSSRKIISG